MTKPLKTPEQLAKEHWDWIEGVILTEMRLTMKLFMDGFVHGYKHGRKDGSKQNTTRIQNSTKG